MLAVQVPEHLRSKPLGVLRISQATRSELVRRGYASLGDLNGMSFRHLGGLRGLSSGMLTEILVAVRRFVRVGAEDESVAMPEGSPANPACDVREGSIQQHEAGIRVPDQMLTWPTSVLGLPAGVIAALRREGISTLGDLQGRVVDDLLQLDGVGKRAVGAVERGLHFLSTPLSGSSFRLAEDGSAMTPNASLEVFGAVEGATTPDEEIDALLVGVPERDGAMLLQRWARPQGRLTTLDDVGEHFGITRERVRQITTKLETQLGRSNLRLPLLSRVAMIVDEVGGLVTTSDLIRHASLEGIALSARALDLVESLGQIGLIPPVTYEPAYALWVSPRKSSGWDESGGLEGEIRHTVRQIQRLIKRDGAAPLSILAGTSLRPDDAVSVLSRRGLQCQVEDGYVVPVPSVASVLTRAIERMVCVTPDLPLEEVHAGLSRVSIQSRGYRVYLDVPPLNVLGATVRYHRRLELTPTGVRLRNPDGCRALLTRAERTVVELIEHQQGVALGSDLIEAVKETGYSQALATCVLRQPFIVRRGTGLYGLRGRGVDPSAMRARLQDRAGARRKSIRSVSYTGGPVARVVYELTAFSIQGVLPVPSRLPDLSHIPWTARVPDGRQFKVRIKNHFLWPLRKWFATEQVKLGDLIVATFYLPEALIELDRLS